MSDELRHDGGWSDRDGVIYRQPTLTDAERKAVERVSVAYDLLPTVGAQQVSATLRGLLERSGGQTFPSGTDRTENTP